MARRQTASARPIRCPQCRHYDPDGPRCRLGKANPPNKRDTVETAQVLGAQILCLRNPWRESLLLRLYRPPRPLELPPALARRDDLEVELLDE